MWINEVADGMAAADRHPARALRMMRIRALIRVQSTYEAYLQSAGPETFRLWWETERLVWLLTGQTRQCVADLAEARRVVAERAA
jgi:hypothetical protein